MKIKKISLLTVSDYRRYKNLIPVIRSWYWLLAPGLANHDAVYFYDDADGGGFGGDTGYGDDSIRPVLWVDAETDVIAVGDEILAGNSAWTAVNVDKK